MSARLRAEDGASARLAWFSWAAICIVWGTTYLAIKVALETIPPFLMGGLRYSIAGVVLALAVLGRGRALPDRSSWGRLAVLAFFMLFFGNGGVVWGEQFVPSGLTSVVIGTTPFWMVSVDAMFRDGKQLHAREWVGLSLGFAGIVLLVWPDLMRGGGGGRTFALGILALQLACAGWAVGSSYTRRHVMPHDVLGAAAMQMLFGGVFMLIGATAFGEWGHLSFTGRTTAAFVYLTIAGSIFAFAAYSYALQHLDLAIVSLYTYINPVIAVALGTLLLGEAFHVRMLIAAAVILCGVFVVKPVGRRKQRMAE